MKAPAVCVAVCVHAVAYPTLASGGKQTMTAFGYGYVSERFGDSWTVRPQLLEELDPNSCGRVALRLSAFAFEDKGGSVPIVIPSGVVQIGEDTSCTAKGAFT